MRVFFSPLGNMHVVFCRNRSMGLALSLVLIHNKAGALSRTWFRISFDFDMYIIDPTISTDIGVDIDNMTDIVDTDDR